MQVKLKKQKPKYASIIPFFSTKNWFLRKGFLQGAFWAMMINVASTSNDVIMRYMGDNNLHWLEISFFRFLFSTLVVLPFMLKDNGVLFKTSKPLKHLFRGVIGAIALAAVCYSVNHMPISANSTILFTDTIFFLIMAYFLLKEDVDWKRWLSTLVCFSGLLIILQPGTESFQWFSLVPVGAAILFAFSNVMVKTMISKENTMTLLFYFGVSATAICIIPLYLVWSTPSFGELFFLLLLGIGANLIQVCIFLAYNATQASALVPFRYAEFLTGTLAGFLFFGQIPTQNIIIGAVIIIISASFITLHEHKKNS